MIYLFGNFVLPRFLKSPFAGFQYYCSYNSFKIRRTFIVRQEGIKQYFLLRNRIYTLIILSIRNVYFGTKNFLCLFSCKICRAKVIKIISESKGRVFPRPNPSENRATQLYFNYFKNLIKGFSLLFHYKCF